MARGRIGSSAISLASRLRGPAAGHRITTLAIPGHVCPLCKESHPGSEVRAPGPSADQPSVTILRTCPSTGRRYQLVVTQAGADPRPS